MKLSEALLYHLKNQTSITNIVSNRIYYQKAPENSAKPFLIINKVSAPREVSFGSSPGLVYGRYQFSGFADGINSYPVAENILTALNSTSVLRDIVGTIGSSGGVQIDYTELIDEGDITIDPSLNISGLFADWYIYYHE
jgi:hypothetical protein